MEFSGTAANCRHSKINIWNRTAVESVMNFKGAGVAYGGFFGGKYIFND